MHGNREPGKFFCDLGEKTVPGAFWEKFRYIGLMHPSQNVRPI